MAANLTLADNDEDVTGSDSDVEYKPSVLKTFKVGIDTITSIAFGDDELNGYYAIICHSKSNELSACDRDGEIIMKYKRLHTGTSRDKILERKIEDISSSRSFHPFLVTSGRGDAILEVTLSSDPKGLTCSKRLDLTQSFKENMRFKATGICVLNDDYVAISVVDHNTYEPRQDNRRFVEIGNFSSRKAIIEFNRETKSHFFTFPTRIAQSGIDDVWIVDRKSQIMGDIKVFSYRKFERRKDFMKMSLLPMYETKVSFKFTYKGSPFSSTFDPTDISSNKKDVVVISDCSNHKIHLVRNDGQFLQYLMTSDQHLQLPKSICVNVLQHVWIGCNNGTMHIVKYIQEFE